MVNYINKKNTSGLVKGVLAAIGITAAASLYLNHNDGIDNIINSSKAQRINSSVRTDLDYLIENDMIDNETDSLLFTYVHDSLENEPSLTEKLGPNAKEYMKNQIVDDYKEKSIDKIRDAGEYLKNLGTKAVDYLKNLGGRL